MKRFYLASAASMLFFSVFAQSSNSLNIQNRDAENNWFRIKSEVPLEPAEVISALSEFIELDENDRFELIRREEDKIRSQHYRYQQMHSGVKVEGAQLLLHINSDGEMRANGRIVNGILASSQNQLSKENALNRALDFIGADHYFWEDPAMEALIKRISKDPNASYFPNGDLVFAEQKYSQDGSKYALNWKFDIYAKGEKMRMIVFVNAINGEISFTQTGIHHDDANGIANTRYHYEQDIITDSTGILNQGFILNDNTRGGGIYTYNLEEAEEYDNYIEFTDSDNYWDNANAELDEAAGDTHWGMEMTYDYFLEEHGRNSFDNQGTEMVSFIHYGINYFNAFWNGQFMTFGDGTNNPLTSIDVVGHEFAHGVTGNSAGLIYYAESGALNESFSDIFGTTIEFFGLGVDSADWMIGRENFTLRNMADPNSVNDPDTYLGMHWVDGEEDNAGVHTNSSVQNKWFYLLSEGGSGTTDFGQDYVVEGIGMTKAAAIAYRNLSVYLTPSSQYADARIGSVQSAEDLYGACSEEVLQTLKAWHAVGIGVPFISKDLNVEEVELPDPGCYLGDSESITVTFKYYHLGCGEVLSAGTVIPIGYRVNDGIAVLEDLILTEDLLDGDEVSYTFDGNIDLSSFGQFNFDFWVAYDEDFISFNDTLFSQSVLHQVVLEDQDIIGFESYTFSPDSFYVETGIHAEAKISSTADNTGTKGFKMSGYEADIEAINWPANESQNFSLNPQYNSKLCFCVDATEWNDVRLAFDMKQLHSAYWNEVFGEDMNLFSSAMRILVNGSQIGSQYHPTTYDDDPYLTYYVYLDDYAGTDFELCFQSKNFLRNIEDPVPGSTGDNTYLDNIRFFDDSSVGIEEQSQSQFSVYPNPNNGHFMIKVDNMEGNYQINVVDALGKVVFQKNSLNAGENNHEISLEGLTRGMYLVQIKNDETTISKRIVIQ